MNYNINKTSCFLDDYKVVNGNNILFIYGVMVFNNKNINKLYYKKNRHIDKLFHIITIQGISYFKFKRKNYQTVIDLL